MDKSDNLINEKTVAEALRSALLSIFGETCLSALEYHLTKILGNDPYRVFYEDPSRFYQGLKTFFGPGAEKILEIIFLRLQQMGALEFVSPAEILAMLERSTEARNEILKMFKKSSRGERND